MLTEALLTKRYTNLEECLSEVVGAVLNDGPSNEATGVHALVSDCVEKQLTGSEMFLVAIETRGHRGSRVIEVYLDADDSVRVGELARFSRALEAQLDELVDGGYKLEVSSPGADRPLTHSRQFAKHTGRKLKIRHNEGEDVKVVIGELVEVEESGLILRTKSDTFSVTFDNLVDGVVQLPW